MHPRKFALCFALLAVVAGSACAMNSPAGRDFQCNVQGGDVLPPASGGADALCRDIEQATTGLRGAQTTVSIQVMSPYALAAKVTVAGRDLPEIRMARSDRELSRASLQRFAQSIAESIAARKP